MDDVTGVHVGQSKQYLLNDQCRILLIEILHLHYSVVQFAALEQFGHDVEGGVIFEQFEYPHYVGMGLHTMA